VRTSEQCEFVDTVRQCHGVIISTPGYHGGVAAPIKNVLDLLEDTARDEQPYLADRAFGCIVCAYGWQACGTTLVSLRVIGHALRAWPTPFGATLNASAPLFGLDGTCVDEKTAQQISMVASQVVAFARWHRSGATELECCSRERLAS
jgi:FMN reductase